MLKRCWLLVLALLVLNCLSANAITLKFTGFIADEANLLSPQVKNDLNMTLWDLQKKSGADLVVVTLPSLNGRSVEEVALDIGRSYKLGAVGKNNGMVFLTAPNERKMRIELGTGLEDKISNSTLKKIRDKDILPYYKQYDYANGITRGAYVLAETVAQAEGVNITIQGTIPEGMKNVSSRSSVCSTCRRGEFCSYRRGRYHCYPWWLYPIAFILAIFSPKRRRFDGGSFGGFGGGGSFGGSGCSGSW